MERFPSASVDGAVAIKNQRTRPLKTNPEFNVLVEDCSNGIIFKNFFSFDRWETIKKNLKKAYKAIKSSTTPTDGEEYTSTQLRPLTEIYKNLQVVEFEWFPMVRLNRPLQRHFSRHFLTCHLNKLFGWKYLYPLSPALSSRFPLNTVDIKSTIVSYRFWYNWVSFDRF